MEKKDLRVHASDFPPEVQEFMKGSGPIHFRGKKRKTPTDEEMVAAVERIEARVDRAFHDHLDRLIQEA